MPKLTLITQKIKNQQFLNALAKTNGNAKEAAKIVGNIGSQGGHNIEKSAAVMGSKRLSKVSISLLEACENAGVTPAMIASKIKQLLNSKDRTAVDRGIGHALKVGIGGGYKSEIPVNTYRDSNPYLKNPVIMEAVKKSDEILKQALINQ